MPKEAAQVTATVVHDPLTAFVGSLQRFWYAQDAYALLIGVAIGISLALIVLIYYIFKKK